MNINPDEWKKIDISNKNIESITNIEINNIVLQWTPTAENLGVRFDRKLTWTPTSNKI